MWAIRSKSDQPLVLLDDRDARLRLDQARASLERAEADAQHAKADASRSGELLEKGFTPRSDFERLANQDTGAGAAVAQARAQVASAQKAVDDTAVSAPFAGHVTARPVAVGEYVTTASKVVTIVRIQPIKLELQVHGGRCGEAASRHAGAGRGPGISRRRFRGFGVGAERGDRSEFARDDDRGEVSERRCPLTPGMFGTAEILLPATEHGVRSRRGGDPEDRQRRSSVSM